MDILNQNEEIFLTVAEVFEILSSKMDCDFIAGYNGMNNRCEHIAVWETPDGTDWLRGHEFLLSSGYAMHEYQQYLPMFVQKISEHGGAAVAIKRGRYLSEFTKDMLEEANRCKLPIISMPREASYTDVTAKFYEKLFYKRNSALVRARNIDSRLLSLVFDYNNTEEVVVALSSLFGISICVYDNAYIESFSCYTADGFHREAMEEFRKRISAQKNAPAAPDEAPNKANRTEPIKLCLPYGDFYAFELRLSDTRLNYRMCVISSNAFDGQQLSAIEQGGMVLSLKYNSEERTAFRELHLRRTATELMLNSEIPNRELLQSIEGDFTWNSRGHYCGIVISYQDRSENGDPDRLKQYMYSVINRLFKGQYLITDRGNAIYIFIKVRNNEDIKRFAERFEMYLTHFPDGKPRLMIGASNIYNSIKELPSMYHDCLVTTMYRSKSGLVFFDQDDAARFLYPLFEDKYFASCYNKTIGSLIQYDQKNKGLLVETLQAYFDNNMNKTETAQALYIHIETLRYRLKKIEKLTGLNMNDSNDLLTLQLGMKFCQMRGINQVLN